MKKRALLVALAAAMAASLAGCGGSSASSTTAAGSAAEGSEAAGSEAAGEAADASGKDSLVIVTSSDVLSMDPYRYDESATNQIMLHIYEALVSQDADIGIFSMSGQKAGRHLRMV